MARGERERERQRERERERVTQQPYALSFTQRPQSSANNTTVRPETGVMHWRYHKNPPHSLPIGSSKISN